MSVAAQSPPVDRLRALLGKLADLQHATQILDWDSRVSMPHRGAHARADASATLARIAHDLIVSDEMGELLDELRPVEDELGHDSVDGALIRVTRRGWERERRVPGDLAAEMSRTSSIAVAAWDVAKAASDFESFIPHLERQLELKHRYVACFPEVGTPYDVLLDEYEEGMTTAQVAEVFDTLKRTLVPLVERLRDESGDAGLLGGPFDIAGQKRACARILDAFGFAADGWRLDETTHPFASSPGLGDVRLTTAFDQSDLHALFSTMHEFGHGVYEWGVDPAFARTPLHQGTSSAVHESQSRTWENLVGRSAGFWRWFYPQLQSIFTDQLGSVDEQRFVRAVNAVRPGLIRVDADEVTYGLHIILRFELEQELLAGRVGVRDLPEAWNARVRDYLGVEVPDDAHGVLQDMHWAIGLVGYFPTYQLGNVLSVQIWRRAEQELGDLDEQFARGEFAPLREWLRENVYRLGSMYPPRELLQRVTGADLDPQPYLDYLTSKFG
ncbi:MAG: carboxypeptidase M32 [Gaiellaceae bacterium]